MAKKNPFDQAAPGREPVIRPDADIRNADWPKRRPDVDAFGNIIMPKAITPTKKPNEP